MASTCIVRPVRSDITRESLSTSRLGPNFPGAAPHLRMEAAKLVHDVNDGRTTMLDGQQTWPSAVLGGRYAAYM